ncbi:PREDICTED: uncharacterized protein LOC105361621 [Ceratosolen solmsi marchali]|uniref:Uncharacterized protein LOC105361621 n=1 Tax=Ceratosolen solmsi marchali TaxID=326594 RepID=A0AAJ7DUS4_9HYME|nr:PREDICTED: uncharacterized protein LOC105361621 [Ceratosolen solmsi marchali]
MNYQPNLVMQKITEKYFEEEKALEEKLRECDRLHEKLKSMDTKNLSDLSLSALQAKRENSRIRNEQFIQDLIKVKAILRTQSAYSPTQKQFQQLLADYYSYLQDEDN